MKHLSAHDMYDKPKAKSVFSIETIGAQRLGQIWQCHCKVPVYQYPMGSFPGMTLEVLSLRYLHNV